MRLLRIISGRFASPSQDPEAAAKQRQNKREELRKMLLRGDKVKINQQGEMQSSPDEEEKTEKRDDTITIPPGKLASFYWYERDPRLLDAEKKAMQRFFPQFHIETLDDGRLAWTGRLESQANEGDFWYLQVIYDHNHPHNNTFGGSIKVYYIDPDLEEIRDQLGQPIPHTLIDSSGYLYICTVDKRHFQDTSVVTSAASALAHAIKWIAAFELWRSGDLSEQEFAGHQI